MDRPLRMVLMCDRRAEEGHDAVTEKLVNSSSYRWTSVNISSNARFISP